MVVCTSQRHNLPLSAPLPAPNPDTAAPVRALKAGSEQAPGPLEQPVFGLLGPAYAFALPASDKH